MSLVFCQLWHALSSGNAEGRCRSLHVVDYVVLIVLGVDVEIAALTNFCHILFLFIANSVYCGAANTCDLEAAVGVNQP